MFSLYYTIKHAIHLFLLFYLLYSMLPFYKSAWHFYITFFINTFLNTIWLTFSLAISSLTNRRLFGVAIFIFSLTILTQGRKHCKDYVYMLILIYYKTFYGSVIYLKIVLVHTWPQQYSLCSHMCTGSPSVTSEQVVCIMCSQRLPAVLSRIGIILASPLVRKFAIFTGTFRFWRCYISCLSIISYLVKWLFE